MKKILVVDDEPDIRTTLTTVLKGSGYDVDEAVNGKDCLDKISMKKYDLLILDLIMPKMDGFEVLKRIPPDIKGKLPVVILSAKEGQEDLAKGYDLGAVQYFTKPFENSQIVDIAKYFLGDMTAEEKAQNKPTSHAQTSLVKRILVVDDEPDIRASLRTLLEAMNYQVDEAADGRDCIDKVSKHAYDLLFLDLVMPEYDGFEVLRMMPNEVRERLPVVILSAKDSMADEVIGYDLGAVRYITKPFINRQIVDVTKHFLGYGNGDEE